jgi:plasmid stability protein
VASITIRNLDEETKQKLRVRAAEHGCSMEEEARNILRAAVEHEPGEELDIVASFRRIFAPLGGVELELPPRGPMREPPDFDT